MKEPMWVLIHLRQVLGPYFRRFGSVSFENLDWCFGVVLTLLEDVHYSSASVRICMSDDHETSRRLENKSGKQCRTYGAT
jgi:hypothetical protein